MSDQIGATVNEWVNLVRRARLGRTTKLVALTLASYANGDGTRIYPGVSRLAVQCEISDKSVRRALTRLRYVGLVEMVRRGGGRNHRASEYRLILGAELLERCTVPSPDEERAAIDRLNRGNREASLRRVTAVTIETAVDPNSGQNETLTAVTTDPPPSIDTLPVLNPPSTQADLRTDLEVVGHPEPVGFDLFNGEKERERQAAALWEWMREQEQAQR